MNLFDIIHSAEQQYIGPVEKFFICIYHEDHLSSHGINHHRRVWKYAKELLIYVKKEDIGSDPLFIRKLLIACYFHDIGMAIDPGIRHGSHSRKLCEQFLKENKLKKSDFADVLYSIEYHDNKDYRDSSGQNLLLTILSVADDLDAFGYTGIYRYLEIYLERGFQSEKICLMVLKNAAVRFSNFENNFHNYPVLIEKHRPRYQILCNYFQNLNSELSKPSP